VVSLPAACDCHVHVIGPRERYPMKPDRAFTPDLATVAELRAHLDRIDFGRVVIVQPSVYGFDNRCLTDALAALGGAARGVAVLPVDVDDAELQRLHALGVRGLRLNLESHGDSRLAGALGANRPLLQRVARLGWHLQIFAAAPVIAESAALLSALPLPVVLDHFALLARAVRDGPVGATIRALVSEGRTWMKLSAPYRVCEAGEPHAAFFAWAGSLTKWRCDRLLWASDWPHTQRETGVPALSVSRYRNEDAGATLQAHRQLWSDAEARQILLTNPAALYGYEPVA
jgi:predicted TIM-barrel fold metal-dependent hydrolase